MSDALIKQALKEDIPGVDLTTDGLKLSSKKGEACLIAKQDLILSGSLLFENTFKRLDQKTKLKWYFTDGSHIKNNSEICVITGQLGSLLKAERTALNFLGHLSGIATLTGSFVSQVAGTQTKIIDTRKTIPGLRKFEKAAVVHGGGENHRMNLSEAILVKENHIRAAGGITKTVTLLRKKWKKLPIEVEVTSEAEIIEALECRVDRLLLDNMALKEMDSAVKLINKRAIIEASGNMTLDRIKSVAKLGVNFISVGSLTHSAPCADISLLFKLT
jgi:nicotinate-nucleotide pyrophosphorylase (carboxylating)